MWREAQARTQAHHWPAVERLLDGLPPSIRRQVKLIEYDLALRYAASGQFAGVFLGVDAFPLTSVGPWMLEDLGTPRDGHREHAESHLVTAAVLMAFRAHVVERILESASFYGTEHVALVQVVSERTMTGLAAVAPAAAASLASAILDDDLEASLRVADLRRAPPTVEDPWSYLHASWSAPARVLAVAATEAAGRAGAGGSASDSDAAGPTAGAAETPVMEMLRALAEAAQIRDDLSAMQRDLNDGRPTFSIALTARVADVPLHPWPRPAVVLGAMVATGSLATILEEARTRLARSRCLAEAAGLPTFMAYIDDVIARLDERLSAVLPATPTARGADGRPATASAPGSTVLTPARTDPLVPAAEATLTRALTMAEGFLFADPSLRESWEMHREGMFGADEVYSRFPEGLILEILGSQGHEVTRQIDDFIAFAAARDFRYFDHPSSGTDSDTVGVCLRLRARSSEHDGHDAAFAAVLARLDRDVRAWGAVPVWIGGDGDDPGRPPVLDLGEGCGTVAAHLLLGLLDLDDHDAPGGPAGARLGHDPETVERGAGHLLARIAEVGLEANVDYPPLYALGRFQQLITRLGAVAIGGGTTLSRAAEDARRVLLDELERARRRRPASPQDAALLILACLEAGQGERLEPSWTATILKGQRFDGGWAAEPFAAAPNRGGSVTWYASTTLTSALCYDALRRAGRAVAP